MICPKCGKGLEDGSKFCIFCGNAVQADSGPSVRRIRSHPGRETYPPRPEVEEVSAQDEEPTVMEEPSDYRYDAPDSAAEETDAWAEEYPGESAFQGGRRNETASVHKKSKLAPILAGTICTAMVALASVAVVMTVRNARKDETLVASTAGESLQQSGALETTEQAPLTMDTEDSTVKAEAAQNEEDLWPEDTFSEGTEDTAGSSAAEEHRESDNNNGTVQTVGSFSGAFEDTGIGSVVGDGTSFYYWKYNSASYSAVGSLGYYGVLPDTVNQLIRMTDGKEEVILEDTGSGTLALVKGKIYYEKVDSGAQKTIWCCSLTDGKTWACQAGRLCGITSDRSYVIGQQDNSETKLFTIRASDGHSAVLRAGGKYAAVHNDKVYYSVPDSEKHWISLRSVDPDGSGDIELCGGSTQDYIMCYPTIGEIRFPTIDGTEYVYFSYGVSGGEALTYQGGKIARVRPDGTGSEVLAGMDDEVNGDFLVNADGTIEVHEFGATTDRFLELYNSGLNWYYVKDGNIYVISDEDGQGQMVMAKEDYSFYSPLKAEAPEADDPEHLDVVSVDTLGNMVFVYFQLGKEQDVQQNWRTRYDLKNGALLAKDLSTGATAEYFRYTVGQ